MINKSTFLSDPNKKVSLVEKLVKIPSSFSVEKEPFLHLHASEGAVWNSVTNRVVGNGGHQRARFRTVLPTV